MSLAKNEISIIGSGYVGVTTAAIAANAGFKVHLIDIDNERIKILKSGKSFFYEEGINPLIKHAVDSGTLLPSTSYESVSNSKIVFSCVGTPDNPDGSSNLKYVFAAAETAAKFLKNGSVYVQKSTVPVGTGKDVIKLLPKNTNYVSNPEFLREGTAVFDTLYFDRIICGGNDKEAIELVMDLYKQVEEHRDAISKRAGINSIADEGQYIVTNLESAELMKVTSNAFLALKISFANSIAKLSDKTGADVVEVMQAVGADKRIGPAFFSAGKGYGGGCFPKDVSGLISSASDNGVDMPIMVAAQDVNESMPGYIVKKAQDELAGNLKDRKVTVLGLAFKAGTSDVRKSPGIKVANILSEAGCNVLAYDPHANDEARDDLNKSVKLCGSLMDSVEESECLFITTEWDEFINADFEKIAGSMAGDLVVDAVNKISSKIVRKSRLRYIGVGKS